MKKYLHLGIALTILTLTFAGVLIYYKIKHDRVATILSQTINSEEVSPLSFDQVHQHTLTQIRLGDGVPMGMQLAVRWKIENEENFKTQFPSVDDYYLKIIVPRCFEITSTVSNTYESVDSVFSPQRQQYLDDIKSNLYGRLGEDGISIKEVIVSNLVFPINYTKAMEEKGMQRQELERIKQRQVADLARAEAEKEKAKADGKVAIVRAEAAGRLQEIQAQTEKSQRAIEMAKAETQNRVALLKTSNEAERNRVLAAAELERQTELKNLELQRLREVDNLAIEKKKRMRLDELDTEMRFAKLCSENPTYASYLVNKELADNVQIAVLPTNTTDQNVFSDLIGQRMEKMVPAFRPE